MVWTRSPVLIAGNSQEAVSEARMRLARIGLEVLEGIPQVAASKRGGRRDCLLLTTSADQRVEVSKWQLQACRSQVLDVRREPEWEAGHIEGALLVAAG